MHHNARRIVVGRCDAFKLIAPRRQQQRQHSTTTSMPQLAPTTPTTVVRTHNASAGCIDYARGWAWQQVLLQRRLAARRRETQLSQVKSAAAHDHDTILLFQHHPVYTLGRGADERYISFLQDDEHAREQLSRQNRGSARLTMDQTSSSSSSSFLLPDHEWVHSLCASSSPVVAPNGVPIFRVERGGEVTFHGPGQLVVYPMLDLARGQQQPPGFQKDLHWFLHRIEEVLVQTLRRYDIAAVRDDAHTGVWVGGDKVAAVGVTASRWITSHGLALNVCPDLSYFDTAVILPCGIAGRGVSSMAEILRQRGESHCPSVPQVAQVVLDCMQNVFQIEIENGECLR